MKQYMISVTSMKCVSTVQVKYNDIVVVTNSNWKEDKESFPVAAIVKAVYIVVKQSFIKRFPLLKKLQNKQNKRS
ncbi:MAG: hypothetical protein AB1394_07485 [Bacteroidota bacterium]